MSVRRNVFLFIGATEDPENTATRIAFLTTFVGGLLLYASYSASLTSFLAIVQVAYPFVDLSSLYYQSDYKIGSIGGTAMDNYFSVVGYECNISYLQLLFSVIFFQCILCFYFKMF